MLSASLASDIDFRSGTNTDVDVVLGVSGADAVVGEELLDPVREVIDRIENRLLLLGGAVVLLVEADAVTELDIEGVAEEEEGWMGDDTVPEVEVGREDVGAEELEEVTPATMEDEIL